VRVVATAYDSACIREPPVLTQVLASLFPGDTGEEVPSDGAHFKVAASSIDFGPTRLDRPYM